MKVNFLITELRTGGAERCLTELAIGLKARGDQVSVMSLMPFPHGTRDELVEQLRAADVALFSANARGFRSLPRATRLVRNWLTTDLPDCLQTFLFHANVIGATAARRAGVLRVVGGVRVADPNRLRSLLEYRAIRRMQALVCVSQSVENFVRRNIEPPKDVRLLTIPNGVRPEKFENASSIDWRTHQLSEGGRVILFLGRLHRQKGLDLLLDVAPTLLRLHPDWRLVIVGEGPLQNAVKRTIQQLPKGQACLLPWQKDVASLYSSADIVIMPSRYEGMPNVILEAMAAGRCVVAADVEGVGELLGSAANLQTFPPGDRGTMVERLNTLLSREDLTDLGEKNRRRAEHEFSVDKMIDRYRQLYSQLISKPPY